MSESAADVGALMRDAVDFSVAVVEAGGLPFVGLVVDPAGYVSDYGVNRVRETGDPSAHAEIVAMRVAERSLDGMYLLATGEPCGLCYRYALDRRIERIYVAVDSDTVAGFGFDYRASYPALGVDRDQLRDVVVPLPVANGLEPFRAYLRRHDPDRTSPEPSSTKGP